MVREIKGFSGPDASADEAAEAEEERVDERPGRPQPLVRSVVATRHEIETFGKLLVSEAYQRCFHVAPRKAFVADGSDANWGVWRRHFSAYVPILDFIHALNVCLRRGRGRTDAGRRLASVSRVGTVDLGWTSRACDRRP